MAGRHIRLAEPQRRPAGGQPCRRMVPPRPHPCIDGSPHRGPRRLPAPGRIRRGGRDGGGGVHRRGHSGRRIFRPRPAPGEPGPCRRCRARRVRRQCGRRSLGRDARRTGAGGLWGRTGPGHRSGCCDARRACAGGIMGGLCSASYAGRLASRAGRTPWSAAPPRLPPTTRACSTVCSSAPVGCAFFFKTPRGTDSSRCPFGPVLEHTLRVAACQFD